MDPVAEVSNRLDASLLFVVLLHADKHAKSAKKANLTTNLTLILPKKDF
jgi:hypothetical protein